MIRYRYQLVLTIAFACIIQTLNAQQASNWEGLNTLQGGYVASSIVTSDGEWWAGVWGGVYSSSDQGRTWKPRGLIASDVYDLTEYPGGILFAATSSGLWKSTDKGNSWENLYFLSNNYEVTHVRVLPDRTVVVGFEGGILYSTDQGKNFLQAGDGLTDKEILSILIHPAERIFVGTHSGIFYSETIGSKWIHVLDSATRGWCDALASSPNGIIYAGFFNKPMATSTDQGNSWMQVPSMPTLGYVKSIVIRSENLVVLSVDVGFGCGHGDIPPGGTRKGLYRSTNRGGSWNSVSNGLDEPKIRCLFPAANGEWLLGTTTGLYVSRDDLQSWNESNVGMNSVLAEAIVSDGQSKLFVAGPTGAKRSDDGGLTWKNISKGLPDSYVTAMARSFDGTLYCAPYSDTIWISSDNGDSWNRGGCTGNGTTCFLVSGIVVDSSGQLYASKWNGLGISIT